MAAGDLLVDFSPQCNEPPSSGAATPDARSGHPVLDFDDSADEAARFTAILPWHYAGGGITVYAVVSFTTDADDGHTARLEIAFERIGDGQQDLDSEGFAAGKGLTVGVPSTCGHTGVASIAFTGAEIDGLAAGELFRVRVVCDTSESDFSGDLELARLMLRETP